MIKCVNRERFEELAKRFNINYKIRFKNYIFIWRWKAFFKWIFIISTALIWIPVVIITLIFLFLIVLGLKLIGDLDSPFEVIKLIEMKKEFFSKLELLKEK